MKQLLILLLLAASLSLPADVTLKQAVRDGMELAAGVRNGRIDVENAARRLRLARSRFLPDLDAGASWRYQSDRMHLVIDPVVAGGQVLFPGLERSVGTRNTWDLYLGVTQPIYSGGILSRRRDQARVQQEGEKQSLQAVMVERATRIRIAYFTHRMLQRRLDAASRLLKRLELHLRRLEALEGEEMVRRSDVLETRSRIADTRLSREELEQAVAEAAVNFHELCGHRPEAVEAAAAVREFTRAEAEEYFRHHHPRLAEMDTRDRWLNLEEDVVAGRYRPTLAAFASLHVGRPGLDMFASDWMTYATAGVNVSLPVFHWHRGRQERGLVDAARRQLINQRREFERGVDHALDRLYRKEKTLGRQETELERLVSLSAEDARLKKQLYREQQISNLDYLAILCDGERYASRLAEVRCRLTMNRLSVQRTIGYMEDDE